MATKERERVGFEDIAEVGSRVSWGAILAGAVMALAVTFVMSLLGAAIGISLSDAADSTTMSIGAGIWGVLTTLVAMFVGGFVATQCTVGENRTEAMIHGVVMWGVSIAMILWLAASGLGAGFNASMQAANAAGNTSQENWQAMARAAGVSDEQLEQWSSQAAATAQDPATQESVQETATHAAWWTLAGVVLSIGAAIGGAMVGAGPEFRLAGFGVSQRVTSRSVAGGA